MVSELQGIRSQVISRLRNSLDHTTHSEDYLLNTDTARSSQRTSVQAEPSKTWGRAPADVTITLTDDEADDSYGKKEPADGAPDNVMAGEEMIIHVTDVLQNRRLPKILGVFLYAVLFGGVMLLMFSTLEIGLRFNPVAAKAWLLICFGSFLVQFLILEPAKSVAIALYYTYYRREVIHA